MWNQLGDNYLKGKIRWMKVMCRDHMQKVGLCNKKTKIYRTIKDLIILFIKLQFSIRYNQAFRPLRTSTSNIDLNLSLNPNGLISLSLASSWCIYIIPIRLITPDLHTTEVSMHPIMSSSGLRAYQAWSPLVYPPGGFCYSRHYFDVPEDKADVRTREKS